MTVPTKAGLERLRQRAEAVNQFRRQLGLLQTFDMKCPDGNAPPKVIRTQIEHARAMVEALEVVAAAQQELRK